MKNVMDESTKTRRRPLPLIAAMAATALVSAVGFSLTRFGAGGYPLELLSHFQVQYWLTAVVGVIVLAVLRRPRLALGGAVALVIPTLPLLPFALGAAAVPARFDTPPAIRVLHANVLTRNTRHDLLLDAVREIEPDVIVLQEVDGRWIDAMTPLLGNYPFMKTVTRDDNFGIAVLSRLPLEEPSVRMLGPAGLPSVTVTVDLGTTKLTLITTHPMAPMSLLKQSMRDDQLVAVTELARNLPRPLLLVGDLNATMWAPVLRRMCDELELTNARRGFGLLPTWPALLPKACRIPIDHCLHSAGITVTDCRLGPDVGSDHLPLVVDLRVP